LVCEATRKVGVRGLLFFVTFYFPGGQGAAEQHAAGSRDGRGAGVGRFSCRACHQRRGMVTRALQARSGEDAPTGTAARPRHRGRRDRARARRDTISEAFVLRAARRVERGGEGTGHIIGDAEAGAAHADSGATRSRQPLSAPENGRALPPRVVDRSVDGFAGDGPDDSETRSTRAGGRSARWRFSCSIRLRQPPVICAALFPLPLPLPNAEARPGI